MQDSDEEALISTGGSCIVELQVQLLVTIIIELNDNNFIQNWERFYDALNAPHPEIFSIKQRFINGGITFYSLLKRILEQWVDLRGHNATLSEIQRVLLEIQCKYIADSLEKYAKPAGGTVIIVQHGVSPILPSNISNSIKPSELSRSFEFSLTNGVFHGRQNELNQIINIFKNKSTHIIQISGIGGIGKTELMKRFCKHFLHKLTGRNGFCILLRGQSNDTFRESLSKEAKLMGVPIVDRCGLLKTLFSVFKNIWQKIGKRPLLLMIDNVDESTTEAEELLKGIRKLERLPFVVLTTRNRNLFKSPGFNIHLSALDLDHSLAFLRISLGPELYFKQCAVKLCMNLQNIPLALQQAVTYIKQKNNTSIGFGISEYLTDFQSTHKRVILLSCQLNPLVSSYDSTVLTTWNMTFDLIKSNKPHGLIGMQLLQILSYLNPSSHIQLPILRDLYSKIFDQDRNVALSAIYDALGLIKKYCLCDIEKDGYRLWLHSKAGIQYRWFHDVTITMNNLVQFAIRRRFRNVRNAELKLIGRCVQMWDTFGPLTQEHLSLNEAGVFENFIHYNNNSKFCQLRKKIHKRTIRRNLYKMWKFSGHFFNAVLLIVLWVLCVVDQADLINCRWVRTILQLQIWGVIVVNLGFYLLRPRTIKLSTNIMLYCYKIKPSSYNVAVLGSLMGFLIGILFSAAISFTLFDLNWKTFPYLMFKYDNEPEGREKFCKEVIHIANTVCV